MLYKDTVKRSYHFYDQELGVFEYYIPIHLNGEMQMTYSRICVAVVPELSPAILVEVSRKLRTRIMSPMGWIDSEMIFIVAPKAVRDEKGNLPKGFPHGIDRKYMTYAIVAEFPLRAVYRILTLVAKFMHKRVSALVAKLNLPTWMSDWFIRSLVKGKRLEVLSTLSQKLSLQVMTLLDNLLALTVYFRSRVKKIGVLIGKLSRLTNAIHTIEQVGKQLKEVLEDERITEAIGHLKLLLVRKLHPSESKPKEKNVESTFIGNDTSALGTLTRNSKEQPLSSPLDGSKDPSPSHLNSL